MPDGLVRPSPPASDALIAAAEQELGTALPQAFASFLRSFDGADLFHEAIVIAGVGPTAPRSLAELNLAEIAEILGVSVPRVHQLKAAAMEKLRLSLQTE